MADELLTPEETAGLLHTKLATLQWWRTTGRGPKYVKIGRRVLYRSKDLEEFVAAGERVPTEA